MQSTENIVLLAVTKTLLDCPELDYLTSEQKADRAADILPRVMRLLRTAPLFEAPAAEKPPVR